MVAEVKTSYDTGWWSALPSVLPARGNNQHLTSGQLVCSWTRLESLLILYVIDGFEGVLYIKSDAQTRAFD